jgi:O-antigen ligase
MNRISRYAGFKPVIAVLAGSFLIILCILLISNRFEDHILLLAALGLPAVLLIVRAIFVSSFRLKTLISQLHWWHMLWLLVFISGLVFRVRNTYVAQDSPIDFWALFRMGIMGFVGLVLVVRLAMKKTNWLSSLFRGTIGLLAAYAIIAIASTLWSVYPLWTLYKSVEYFIDIVLIAAIVVSARSVYDYKVLFDWTWVLLGLLAASAWLGILIWPDIAIRQGVGVLGGQLAGVLPAMETNKVGELGAILGIVALNRFLFMKDKGFYFVIFLVAMTTMVFAQSRSPIMGFLMAVPLMLFAARRIGPIALTFMLMFFLIFLTGVSDVFWEYFLRGQNREEFSSLSGRTYGWVLGWELFKLNPLMGFGAYAGGRFAVLAELGTNMSSGQWSSILNTWLEILIGVGLIGALLVVAAFIKTWVNLLKGTMSSEADSLIHCLAVEGIGILALLSVRSMFTTNIFWHPPLIFFLLVGYGEFLYMYYRRAKYKNRDAAYRKSLMTT